MRVLPAGLAAPHAPPDSLPPERLSENPEPPPLPLTLRNVPPSPELRPALLREVPAQAGAGKLQHPFRGHGLHGQRRGRADRATDGAAAAAAVRLTRRIHGRRRHFQTSR